MNSFDVAIIGGGVVGTSAAWLLAEAGVSVVLLERERLAAGASGRNQGVVQHPLEPLAGELYRATLAIYGRLAAEDAEFEFGRQPAGLLLVSDDTDALRAEASEVAARAPELRPELLSAEQARLLEPALAPGIAACRLETGYPVAPAAATHALARRASRAGATLRLGEAAEADIEGERVHGVRLASGERIASRQVLLAAGPWTSALVPAWRDKPPIRPVWGVVASVALSDPPRHVLEELGISDKPSMAPALFSLVSTGGQTGLGAVWLEEQPDERLITRELLKRGSRFVPALAEVGVQAVRSCARPMSTDGRALVGPLPGLEGLFVCAGHGPWGISTGPATAQRVVEQMLGRTGDVDGVPAELAARRWPTA